MPTENSKTHNTEKLPVPSGDEAELAALRAEARDARAMLLKADAALLDGQLVPELYDKILASKLAVLKDVLEREKPLLQAAARREAMSAALQRLQAQARGMVRSANGLCPICVRGSCRFTPRVEVIGWAIAYGAYCPSANRYVEYGQLTLPADLIELVEQKKK